MNIAVFSGRPDFIANEEYSKLESALRAAGHNLVYVRRGAKFPSGVELLLSVGGDGTFLSASDMAAPLGIPVLGVNLGRLGFLSENTPEAVRKAIAATDALPVEDRALLSAKVNGRKYVALNDVVVARDGNSMLGVKVEIDGKALPTYWADGLVVSTPSGSTAYSLSAGGPIVLPSSKVFIIAPIAPHNLNVRPLIVPQESRITMKFESREPLVGFSADNAFTRVPSDCSLEVGLAQFSLKRVCLDKTNFIKALSEKLFWGEDKRNIHTL